MRHGLHKFGSSSDAWLRSLLDRRHFFFYGFDRHQELEFAVFIRTQERSDVGEFTLHRCELPRVGRRGRQRRIKSASALSQVSRLARDLVVLAFYRHEARLGFLKIFDQLSKFYFERGEFGLFWQMGLL